jgi:hypothetical protein
LDCFDEDKRHLLTTYARHLNFGKAAAELGIAPKALRSRLERLRTKQRTEAPNKGLPITLPGESVGSFKASSPLLAELESLACGPEIRLTPILSPQLKDQRLVVKMVSGIGEESVTLPFFDLRVSRFGRLEMELKSTQRSPVEVTVLITRNQLSDTNWKINVSLQLNCFGADARAASNAIRFIQSIDQTSQFKIVGLENDQLLMWSISGIKGSVPMAEDFADMVHRTAKVADYFNQAIVLPRHITEEDVGNLETLYNVVTGDPFEVRTWDGHIIKEEAHRENVAMMNAAPFNLTIRQRSAWKALSLMGVMIDTGLIGLHMTECSLESVEDFQRDYEAAEEGEPVPLKLRISGPCQFLPQ